MPSLASITGIYFYRLFGWDNLAGNKWWVLLVGVIFIFLMTVICVIGIELNARTQFVLLALELAVLVAFAAVAPTAAAPLAAAAAPVADAAGSYSTRSAPSIPSRTTSTGCGAGGGRRS